MIQIEQQECLEFLKTRLSNYFELIYIDPPYNTGKEQRLGEYSYQDSRLDYLSWLNDRLVQARRVLTETGSIFVHVDPRYSHYVKIQLDKLFGRESFQNEIIWSYDYGGRSKRKWSSKHDTLFWYSKDPNSYTFNYGEIDRIPYLAPKLVGAEKAAQGKTPTDVWWNTIVHTTGKERTGYPTQKPLAILKRIVAVHSDEGDTVLDFFAGSGTTGQACKDLDRDCILVDSNPQAIEVMKKRLL